MADDEGASPREQLLEACRRDNTSLLHEVIHSLKNPAELLNTARDGVGNYCLHLAARSGNYEVLDILLDQEGLEVDPLDRLDGDTPLHKAVRYVNELERSQWQAGAAVVELLLDAGADPRVRNKAKLKPFELVDPRNTTLRTMLQHAEFADLAGDDIVDQDEEDQGGAGSASDSD